MSSKVTNINAPWIKATEGLVATLDKLSWEQANQADQKKNLRLNNLDGAPNALKLEWIEFQWLRKKIGNKSEISAENLKALIHKYQEVGNKYKAVSDECYDEFKIRQATVFDVITHSNKLTRNRTNPSLTLNHSSDTQKHNAKIILQNLIWDKTEENSRISTSIRTASVMEKSIVNTLTNRIERERSLDTSAYTAIIMHLRGVHEKYQISPAIEAEFAARQTQLQLAMRVLYEHHKDSNLFTNENLEHAKQHKLTNQQHDDTTEPGKTTKTITNILVFERPAPLPS